MQQQRSTAVQLRLSLPGRAATAQLAASRGPAGHREVLKDRAVVRSIGVELCSEMLAAAGVRK